MDTNEPGQETGGVIDPSFFRGLTQRRVSRRSALAMGGVGASSLLFSACGSSSPSSSPSTTSKLPNANVGTGKWWTKQELHHKLVFANWPYYIDVLNGKRPTLEHFTATTGIKVTYDEVIQDNASFYATIRPSLAAGQATGYDVMVMTNNNPELGYLIQNGWLVPIDHALMPNFKKYASSLVTSPPYDPGNKYSMAWQSGWTSVGYNAGVVKDPGDSVDILFNKKYAGKVGMLTDPFELGSVGLLAIGVEPAKSTESDWSKAAKKLQQQKSDGIVAAYYDQSYINHLKNGDIVVSQCYSGDIFQANLNSKYRDLTLMYPKEGLMIWTDNMIIPLYAANPLDAMTIMDYFYSPITQSVVEYYNDYICPVPDAKEQLLHPTGWNKAALKALFSEIQEPPSVTADAFTVFPGPTQVKLSRPYYPFKSSEEITAWENLFLPIIQGA